MRLLGLVAVVALLPAMTGPVQASEIGPGPLVLALCGGGHVLVPLGNGDAPAPGTAPCCAKGCQRDDKRRKARRANLRG
jgi:hypothetical protein